MGQLNKNIQNYKFILFAFLFNCNCTFAQIIQIKDTVNSSIITTNYTSRILTYKESIKMPLVLYSDEYIGPRPTIIDSINSATLSTSWKSTTFFFKTIFDTAQGYLENYHVAYDSSLGQLTCICEINDREFKCKYLLVLYPTNNKGYNKIPDNIKLKYIPNRKYYIRQKTNYKWVFLKSLN